MEIQLEAGRVEEIFRCPCFEMLTANVVRKILTDCFGNAQEVAQDSWIRVSADRRLEWLNTWAERAKKRERVESRAWTSRQDGDAVMGVFIHGIGDGGNASGLFPVAFRKASI